MAKLRFGKHTINLPRNRMARTVVGVALIIFGIFGFLPVVGFWMIPLGLLVLSIDSAWVRRLRREYSVKLMRWLKTNHTWLWRRVTGAP